MNNILKFESVTIELFGSYGARCGDVVVDLNHAGDRRRKGAIPPLCRKLIEHGYDPQTRVHVVRDWDGSGCKSVFKNDLTIQWWADRDFVDEQDKSVRSIKYRSFGGGKAVFSPLAESGTDYRDAAE